MNRFLASIPGLALLAGCAGAPTIPTAGAVELERFMGDWYVIASIPTRFEKGAHNAVESYRLDPDGSIATTFTYRDGAFDGPQKVMRPRGFVRDRSRNAVWGMQFVWPIKAEYVIAYVDAAYSQTIIARSKRDYVWIMARTPTLPSEEYARLQRRVQELGYDLSKLQKVPQRWDRQGGPEHVSRQDHGDHVDLGAEL
ncbi:MAG TPA: lipocalin family protein [Steroidobacteraceae bacterium]|nr:lipocalin family protein [Steroidobacteraceae bacterium]